MDIQTLKVEEFTSVDPITANDTDSISMVKMKMKTNEIRHIPIVKSNKVVGIITHRDLEKVQEDSNLKASDVMTEDPFTVQKSALLKDVVFYMSNKKIGSALVVGSNDELYGIFTSIDALNSIIEMA